MSPPMYELLDVGAGRAQLTPTFMLRASYYLKCQLASIVLFWTCLWSVKASFLAFFYQLTERLTWPRRAWWVLVVFTTLAFTASVISYPLSCTSFTVGKLFLLLTMWSASKIDTDFSRRVLESRECQAGAGQFTAQHDGRHRYRRLQSVYLQEHAGFVHTD